MPLVECVPNFSEGRDRAIMEAVCAAIDEVRGARVLDLHMDADHNRSVVTFVAEVKSAVDAAVSAAARGAALIDISRHAGEHPRMGAIDVLPFVPLAGVGMETCVHLAHEAGKRIARELDIPVYFYGAAARDTARRNLEDVRRGGFERLREEIAAVHARAPDEFAGREAGELPRIHRSAGACAIGARDILIAYNVDLDSDDLSVARDIAREVRARDGGLAGVKALGLRLASRGIVQVSMNLIDYRMTGIAESFAAVEREANARGIEVARGELVGLAPRAALDSIDPTRIGTLLSENDPAHVTLEDRIAAAFA